MTVHNSFKTCFWYTLARTNIFISGRPFLGTEYRPQRQIEKGAKHSVVHLSKQQYIWGTMALKYLNFIRGILKWCRETQRENEKTRKGTQDDWKKEQKSEEKLEFRKWNVWNPNTLWLNLCILYWFFPLLPFTNSFHYTSWRTDEKKKKAKKKWIKSHDDGKKLCV